VESNPLDATTRAAEGGGVMVKVYGYSDDLVTMENTKYIEHEIDCFNRDVLITFEDGTVIRVGYPKRMGAIWWIRVVKTGTADHIHTMCTDEDADIYSDIFEIDSEVESHKVVRKEVRDA